MSDTYTWSATRVLAIIRTFRQKTAEAVFNGKCPQGFPADIFRVARRKLEALNAATNLGDLRVPPSNRLEAFKGDRAGQHSIRINDQWRTGFRWTTEGPTEIVDYH
jgi:toxin HigB-1